MSKAAAIQKLETKFLKTNIPDFRIGDTVRVHTRIIEGEKERIQVFMGTVIARKGTGYSETFSVHRVAYGEGMERVFPLHSPRIAEIEVVKEGKVRRSKLYYLRGTSGKAAKVKGRLGARRKEAGILAEAEVEKEKPELQEEAVAAEEPQEEIKEEAVAAEEPQEEIKEEAVKAEEPQEEIKEEAVAAEESREEIKEEAVKAEEPQEEVKEEAVKTEEQQEAQPETEETTTEEAPSEPTEPEPTKT